MLLWKLCHRLLLRQLNRQHRRRRVLRLNPLREIHKVSVFRCHNSKAVGSPGMREVLALEEVDLEACNLMLLSRQVVVRQVQMEL